MSAAEVTIFLFTGMTEEYSPVSVNRDVGTEQPSLWIHSSEEPSSTEREHKRITHNNSEKQRKEKIKSKIANIGHLLPAVRCYEKQSTLSILERAADYISEIQDKNDQLMYHNGDEVQAEEIQSLRQKLDDLKSERDRFADLLKTAGISTLLNATNSWKGKKANCTSSTSDCRPESADTTSNIPNLSANNSKKDNDQEGSTKSTKSKRRNTICAQLERIQNKNTTDKATTALKMNTGNIIIPGLNNLNGMQTTNVLPTNINQQQLFAAAPNLLASTLSNAILASNGHGHVIFSNANSAGGVVSIQAPTNQPGVTFVSPSPNLLAGTDKGNGDGAGLLQIAMRDAGITTVTQSFLTQPSAQVPQITNQSTPAMIGSITSTNTEAVTSADSSQVPHSTPLQTLASIASNTQSINTGLIGSSFLGGTSCFQQGSNSVSSTQVVSSGLWNSVSLNTDQEASSTSIQSVVSANEVCVTTSAESTITQSPSTSHTSDNTGTTDILAKAAESIFSSSLHDISPPISSFYNPANEDNPLHIDTSAGETEDDCSAQSPSKESCDSDNIPTSSRIEMEVESQSSHSLDNTCNSLTVTSNSASAFFKETDMCEAVGAINSYSNKIVERAQTAAEEITCTTSIQVTNSRASSQMLVTSPASTANNNVDNDNTGENNQIKMTGIVEPKQLHLHCDSQPTSNAADDMLSKNTCSNQQMSTTSQTSSVNNLSSSQPQHPPCNLQSQQISTPSASLPSSVNSISTSVDPTEGNCINSSAQMAPPCTTEHNSYSSPNSLRYSAESLFNPSNKLTTQSKSQLQSQAQIIIPHHTSNITNSIGGEALSTTATLSTAAPVSSSKSRNSGIYSAENFVQSGRNDTSRSDNKHSYSSAVFSSTNNTVHHLSTSESDSLSFSNLVVQSRLFEKFSLIR
ncbi:unnamed protein product [Acanthosepion pharaonis]|uniref:BHLH domain-containing protein n=1 Tax=Acanthosepion pharaonis TaxID=158019 RepID=A0A812D0U6_ACAPH|nr:unnamed protein product [Sepia pharaonis]